MTRWSAFCYTDSFTPPPGTLLISSRTDIDAPVPYRFRIRGREEQEDAGPTSGCLAANLILQRGTTSNVTNLDYIVDAIPDDARQLLLLAADPESPHGSRVCMAYQTQTYSFSAGGRTFTADQHSDRARVTVQRW